ncbi:LysR substrate-binding domain-containing protein, partial [Pseudomonas emilianonis]|uniref:LysR substrate-binding domain-containing protein n=1 Tax=Pseudomonas emilianonis TaxID=2915812 RepID=UPI0031F4F19C
GLEFLPFLNNPIVAVAPPDHPLSLQGPLRLKDLEPYTLLLRDTSLLSVEPGLGPERYRLLNSVRSYALAQLRDPLQVAQLQQGYGHYLGAFSGRPFVLQLVEQAAHAD